MLTCKVGDSMVNTMDYSNEQIRKWSKKNILKCPVCDGEMIYKNGLIKIEHFAHKKDECSLEYHENETKEHLEGKVMLYDFIKTQKECENVQLESWIPETKQRPDIYFEKDGKRFVIEFQCIPIASEYLERHELYRLANINDIWIMGTDNYNIKYKSGILIHSRYFKILEKYLNLYLNIKNSKIYFNRNLIKQYLPNDVMIPKYYGYKIDNFKISNNDFIPKKVILDYLISEYSAEQNIQNISIAEKDQMIDKFNITYKNDNIKFDLSYNYSSYNSSKYYNWRIDLITKNEDYIFFIKHNEVSFCVKDIHLYSNKLYSKNYKKIQFIDIDSFKREKLNNDDIFKFISIKLNSVFQEQLKKHKKEQRKQNKKQEKILNKKILIIDGDYSIDEKYSCNVYKLLKGRLNFYLRTLEDYILNNKNDTTYILHNQTICGQSISNANRLYVIEKFNSLGFTDVSFL